MMSENENTRMVKSNESPIFFANSDYRQQLNYWGKNDDRNDGGLWSLGWNWNNITSVFSSVPDNFSSASLINSYLIDTPCSLELANYKNSKKLSALLLQEQNILKDDIEVNLNSGIGSGMSNVLTALQEFQKLNYEKVEELEREYDTYFFTTMHEIGHLETEEISEIYRLAVTFRESVYKVKKYFLVQKIRNSLKIFISYFLSKYHKVLKIDFRFLFRKIVHFIFKNMDDVPDNYLVKAVNSMNFFNQIINSNRNEKGTFKPIYITYR